MPPAVSRSSAAPPRAAAFAPVTPDARALQPAASPADAEPDSGPTAPTVTNAPEAARLSIRIPRAALALPVAAVATYLLLAYRPSVPEHVEVAPRSAASAVAASDSSPLPAAEAAETTDSPALADPNPAAPLLTAAKIVELERAREQAQQLDAARRQVKVVLYTSERCSRCVEARTHLLAQGIRPTERDVDKDPRARARHRTLSRKGGLPTIEVEGKVLVGFQEDRLQKAIDRAATLRMKRKR